MRLYTVEDMINAIGLLEGIRVTLPTKNMMFTKLYSEIFDKCVNTDEEARIKQIQDRIKRILVGEFGNILPKIDREPNEADAITIYGTDGHIDFFNDDQSVNYVQGFRTRDASLGAMVNPKYANMFIVDHATKFVLFFTRESANASRPKSA